MQLVNGEITFNPTLLRASELLIEKSEVDFLLSDKTTHTFKIEKDYYDFYFDANASYLPVW